MFKINCLKIFNFQKTQLKPGLCLIRVEIIFKQDQVCLLN